jgi:hypothetical protein
MGYTGHGVDHCSILLRDHSVVFLHATGSDVIGELRKIPASRPPGALRAQGPNGVSCDLQLRTGDSRRFSDWFLARLSLNGSAGANANYRPRVSAFGKAI